MNTLTYENLHEVKKHVSSQFPYNTYLCSIPLDFTQVPLHWHNDVEIIVIKKGCGIISVDTEPRAVKAGDIILVRPGQLHSISQHEKTVWNMKTSCFRAVFYILLIPIPGQSDISSRILHWNINFHGSLTIPVPPMKNFLPVLMQSMTSALSVRTIMNYQ